MGCKEEAGASAPPIFELGGAIPLQLAFHSSVLIKPIKSRKRCTNNWINQNTCTPLLYREDNFLQLGTAQTPSHQLAHPTHLLAPLFTNTRQKPFSHYNDDPWPWNHLTVWTSATKCQYWREAASRRETAGRRKCEWWKIKHEISSYSGSANLFLKHTLPLFHVTALHSRLSRVTSLHQREYVVKLVRPAVIQSWQGTLNHRHHHLDVIISRFTKVLLMERISSQPT